jgi:DNA polymerase III delta prime subunit
MNSFQNIKKENLHHANLIIGDLDFVENELLSFFDNKLNFSTIANEFFTLEKYDKFLTKDAEKIFDIHLRKTPQDQIQVIVIFFNFITREAQNKILKMLEEPKDRTYFFLVAPNRDIFLETILSRVNLFDFKNKEHKFESSNFFEKSIGERIKFISEMLKDIKDEKVSKQTAIDFVNSLELEIYNSKISKTEKAEKLKIILESKKYMNLTGASLKILLETIVISI